MSLPLQGLRILVAEDAPLNQELVAGILRDAGAIVIVANDGREAVDVALHAQLDLVLMDLQMPQLDGLGAARELREADVGGLPIVALTADDDVATRERCFTAGMNDFACKPVDAASLLAQVARWTGRAVAAATTAQARGAEAGASGMSAPFSTAATSATSATGARAAPSATATAAGATDPPDLPGLDLGDALRRLGGNDAVLRELLAAFIDEEAATVTRIRQAAAKGDLPAARRDAHALKGLSINLGGAGVAAAARGLEQADATGLQAAAEAVAAEFERMSASARRWLAPD